MSLTLAKRMQAFQPSIFSQLVAYKNKKISEGCDIIDLSIGNPDMPTPSFVVNALSTAANDPTNYGYSLTGTDEFNEAVATYYEENYHASLDAANDVLLLMGSQDGLVHLPMVFANPGDIILVPDPGYTAYATGIAMAGAAPYFMPLHKENDFLPDLQAIPEEVAKQAKMMILNFPGNPVPAMANEKFFIQAIAFAKKYNIVVVHDFAYSELYYDNQKPVSFLAVPGAKDVGIEINSFSKSFNMAGCRIGYICGNTDIVQALKQLKSNLDYGVFLPTQQAAITALREGASFCEQNRSMYQGRRNLLVNGLRSIGWNVDKPAGGMFVWAKIPNGWNSTDFAFALIDRANVVVTPGQAFGPTGEGYVRIALVQNEERLKQVIVNLEKSQMFSLQTV
ncbi:LL-diaminopimelate aminotransferase [Microbacteriaceae bacterium 4G12]